jgi:uncharacterized membrane protein
MPPADRMPDAPGGQPAGSGASRFELETVLGYGLVAGIAASLVLLLLGFVLLIAQAGSLPIDELIRYPGVGFPMDLPGVLSGIGSLEPLALVQAGLLLLIATPLLRVVLAGMVFCREREWLFALVALAILAVLLWGWRGV